MAGDIQTAANAVKTVTDRLLCVANEAERVESYVLGSVFLGSQARQVVKIERLLERISIDTHALLQEITDQWG